MPSDKHLPELKVLARRDAAVVDENDWPQFDIRDVEIRDADGSLTSLFLADPSHPVTLTGQVVVKGSQPRSVLKEYRAKSRVPIVVNNITYFAFGVFDTGGYAIWAAGEAGWHTIHPAKAYETVFEHMVEGLSILYFLVEAYDNAKKAPAADVFKRYAKANKISVSDATYRFFSHAPFLASRMTKGEENIKWEQTSFYQLLKKLYPEVFAPRPKTAPAPARAEPAKVTAPSAKAKASAAPAKTSAAPTRTAVTRTQTRETSSRSQSADLRPTRAAAAVAAAAATSAPKKKATRSTEPAKTAHPQPAATRAVLPRKASQQSQSQTPLLSDMNKTRARDVWKFMQQKSNDTLPEISEMTIETFAHFLFQEYEFEDEKEAQYFLKYLAPDLVGMMSIRRNRIYDPWTELPVYDELMEAKVPSRFKARVASLKLQKRDTPLPGQEEDTEPSDEDSSEESVMDKEEATNRKREAARRRISALRPKSGSKYSGKAAKRKGKEKATSGDDEEMLDADENLDEDVMDIDTPSKRKSMSEDEGEADAPEYPNKRFTRSQGALDPELVDLEFEIQQARSTAIPIRRKMSQLSTHTNSNGHAKSHEPRMRLVSEPAPSMEANAPGDVWNCPHAGCVHKVYGASEYENKDLIREHLLDHKEKDRVDLIRGEENMTRLPVNHLLKRIREIAERNGGEQLRPLEGGLMGLFPPSLERKVY